FFQRRGAGADCRGGNLYRPPDRCSDVPRHAAGRAPCHRLRRFLRDVECDRAGHPHGAGMMPGQCNRKQALLVIGMHRSGTSVLTRLINLHGVTLGSDLLQAAADNETGFWENQHVVRFHERLLAALGSSWDDPRELREGWLEQVRVAGFRDELVALITGEFGDAPIWAIKDPRLCRLLPLWLKVLGWLDIEPKLIFAMRHPGEVVGSLMQRNELPAATA